MKWINDVFIGGQKVCGVLPKAEMEGNSCHLWIGIGVNININPIQGSTCLKKELGLSRDIEVSPFID